MSSSAERYQAQKAKNQLRRDVLASQLRADEAKTSKADLKAMLAEAARNTAAMPAEEGK